MRRYVLTPLAQADVAQIGRIIGRDSEDAADRVEKSIYDACEFLRRLRHGAIRAAI